MIVIKVLNEKVTQLNINMIKNVIYIRSKNCFTTDLHLEDVLYKVM